MSVCTLHCIRSGADNTLWKVAAGALPAFTPSATGYRFQVLADVLEGPDIATSYYCSRLGSFFTASVAGNYTFLLDADDYAQLNATYYNVSCKRSCPCSGWDYLVQVMCRSTAM